MELGAFSVSLAVKDLQKSKDFYEKFGFEVFGGDAAENWVILKNGTGPASFIPIDPDGNPILVDQHI